MLRSVNGDLVDKPWKLRGLSKRVALFASAAFLAGAVLAAAADLYSNVGWSTPTLQAWTLLPQTVAAGGLLFLGFRCDSRAFYILGGLIALIVIEEAFHVLNPVAGWLGRYATWVLVYGVVAFIGLVSFVLSHWYGSIGERRVIRNMAILVVLGGLFGGPVSIVATRNHQLRWLFAEEFGEAVVFAMIGGYVAGLVARASVKSKAQASSPSPCRSWSEP